MLISVDDADLLNPIKDVRGGQEEPIARLTPSGWTCIGGITAESNHTHFAFFSKDTDQLSYLLNRYWDIDDAGDQMPTSLDPVSEMVQESLSFDKGRYTVGPPRKPGKRELPDDQDMALKRLEGSER